MIGVIAKPEEIPAVEEFFQLFKTPWELFKIDGAYDAVITTGDLPDGIRTSLLLIYSACPTKWDCDMRITFGRAQHNELLRFSHRVIAVYGQIATFSSEAAALGFARGRPVAFQRDDSESGCRVVRVGYALFQEVRLLLSHGQPPENASIPALDLHIALLRQWMLDAGIPVVEIPPAPAGHPFIACLTHDIDFLQLRQHRFDHTMLGFLQRATIGSLAEFARGRITREKLFRNWRAVLELPLVHLGLRHDFWVPFDQYLKIERGRPATYFLIPFRNHPGAGAPKRRATRYDISDVQPWIGMLHARRNEIAVHGIDAWCDAASGRKELCRVAAATGEPAPGVRMHWLYSDADSPQKLEAAGYSYDSTCGYNDAVGWRAGTGQVFKPLAVEQLLELPFEIQDTAMFFKDRMNLAEPRAWSLCAGVINHCRTHGGALTVLWHDRSLVPERLWDRFYARLLAELDAASPWFGTASQVVDWFRARRAIQFEAVRLDSDFAEVQLSHVPEMTAPNLQVRVHWPGSQPVDAAVGSEHEMSIQRPQCCDKGQSPARAATLAG